MNSIEMTKNHAALKKCNNVYRFVTTVYVITCGAYIIASMYLALMPFDVSVVYLLLNGPVFKGAVLAAGFMGAYKNSESLALAAPVIMLTDMLIFWNADNYFDMFWGVVFGMKINAVYFVMTVILAVITVIADRKYHYLEQQPGFPQFSEVFEQQKTGRPQYGQSIEERVEQLKKNERSEMDGI